MASLIGGLKLATLVGVLASLKEIATAIGEQVAKWAGYSDLMAEVEIRTKAQEAASRSLAEGNAALAQSAQIAADKALGLGFESQALVGTFKKARLAGDTVSDSLGKVAGALDLSDLDGIRAASAALDALAVRGKITGDQMRDALASALRTEDLGRFQVEATAAFDQSEIGARLPSGSHWRSGQRVATGAGLSAEELQTGFGGAAASAINDVDALSATLDRLGAKGPEADRALARAADTERSINSVISRYD